MLSVFLVHKSKIFDISLIFSFISTVIPLFLWILFHVTILTPITHCQKNFDLSGKLPQMGSLGNQRVTAVQQHSDHLVFPVSFRDQQAAFSGGRLRRNSAAGKSLVIGYVG
ncbi:MAG: hypothetical protein IJ977_05030 [Fibrobacter sp.]|nr:hypothetical protein [Fibrobacter sp.]